MIKSILQSGLAVDYVYINKRYPGFPTQVQDDTILVRWNGKRDCLEGLINGSWQDLGFEYEIVFTDRFTRAMSWIDKKIDEEAEIIKVINKYPEIKKLKEQLDIMVHLVRRHEDEPNS